MKKGKIGSKKLERKWKREKEEEENDVDMR